MKNKLHYTSLLVLLVVAGLLLLHHVPIVRIGGNGFREVDLLSDIRKDTYNQLPDSLIQPDTVAETALDTVRLSQPVFLDSCKAGIECIEDYSDSTMRGMSRFYEALSRVGESGRPVRIAYLGDSFIEGDILTSDLRFLLQKEFGGSGVGYVPVSSKIPGFRPTVRHSFEGWRSHAVTDTAGFDSKLQGLSNDYFRARRDAFVSLSGVDKYFPGHDLCSVSSLFYRTNDSLHVTATINGVMKRDFYLKGDGTLQSVSVHGNIRTVVWRVKEGAENAVFYAATMDSDEGVILDNFSTRGSSGKHLSSIPYPMLKKHDKLRKYDLIVLQYGLNVVFEGGKDYVYYKEGMKPVIKKFKSAFPDASILIVSVGDRETKDDSGNLRTMPGLKNLIRNQQALAAETGVAFWNMFNAMGGDGSMSEMVNAKPAMANYDYTHINFRGGKHIASLLFDALMYGKEQYEKRKAYEAE